MSTIFKQVFQGLGIAFFVLLLLPLQAVAACKFPYKDVDYTHWAYTYAKVMYCNKFMEGVSYERFGGELELTRFQFAEALNGLIGQRQINLGSIVIISDISPSSPKYKIVERVVRADLMQLTDMGEFQGLRKVERYEFAESLDKYLTLMGSEPPVPREQAIGFNDVEPDYEETVERITNLWQVTNGYSNGTFRGANNIKRYEALVMLAKAAALLYEDVKAELDKPIPTPSMEASSTPSTAPSVDLENLLGSPSPKPSAAVSAIPSAKPSAKPSTTPTVKPSSPPTSPKPSASSDLEELENLLKPSAKPSSTPKPTPTPKPTASASLTDIEKLLNPSAKPSSKPSAKPTPKATATPSSKPSAKPSPTPKPSAQLSDLENLLNPSTAPTVKPSAKPSTAPTSQPSAKASVVPSAKPSATPSATASSLKDLENQLANLSGSPAPNASPSVNPSAKPSIKPMDPESLIDIPLPSASPSESTSPSPEPSNDSEKSELFSSPLRNRLLLMGNMRLVYEERVPGAIKQELQMPDSEQTVSGDAGTSLLLDGSYWFDELLPQPWDRLGVNLTLSTLGGISFTSNSTSQTADLTETIFADLAVMYKLIHSPQFDLAAGLDNYFRSTGSSNDPRSHYFLAARSYMGFGAKVHSAYRIWGPLTLELSVAPHFVLQDLSNIAIASVPLSRLDFMINFLINWDIMQMGPGMLSADLGYNGLILMDLGSEGSQTAHGVTFGVGYHF